MEPRYELVRKHFTERELVDLTITVFAINGWKGFREQVARIGQRPRRSSSSARTPSHSAMSLQNWMAIC